MRNGAEESPERTSSPEDVVPVITGFPWWLRPFLLPRVAGLTLGRRIYISGQVEPGTARDRLILHEREHVRQIARTGIARFLVSYFGEYLRGRLSGRSHRDAYRGISWEIEARQAETTGSLHDGSVVR